ncbi:hypothetical protein CBP31_07120 [Oceanisphaera profunda]|uniref:Uncharacterized protein n=1 Tax=Oceanisphaera profunda TaxID=1416627 RepID=A0A1Y0D4I8_9GAMM|nr:hypothetical protein CBP31_07120 [Oceanisphaera profunda]
MSGCNTNRINYLVSLTAGFNVIVFCSVPTLLVGKEYRHGLGFVIKTILLRRTTEQVGGLQHTLFVEACFN